MATLGRDCMLRIARSSLAHQLLHHSKDSSDHACFSGFMLWNPPTPVAFPPLVPPLRPISETCSWGRLAKLLGLILFEGELMLRMATTGAGRNRRYLYTRESWSVIIEPSSWRTCAENPAETSDARTDLRLLFLNYIHSS